MAGLSHKRLVAELSLDELLAHGVEQAETELLHTNGVSTAADTPVAHPARNGKRARSAAGDEVAAAEVSPAEDAVPDSRPFVLFAAPKRRRVEPQPEEGTRVEEPNAAHVVVSDLSGLVPLSEDAPFKSLGLNDWLASNCTRLGLRRPTPVQHACIPAVLAGRDAMGIAQTGSGKTAAFALPLLQRLVADPFGVHSLVLTPTRELALQIGEQFVALAAGFSLRCAVLIGGQESGAQAAALVSRPHVVVATPGRLRDQLDAQQASRDALARCAALVLDEADRLLEPSFEADLAAVLSVLPRARQTLLFSATLTPSVCELQRLTRKQALLFAVTQGVSLPVGLSQRFVLMPAKVKEVYLAHLLSPDVRAALGLRKMLVFAATVRDCQLLADMLSLLGTRPAVLHSALRQRDRAAALAAFRGGSADLLVATDVASRGLDIPHVDGVLHADVPASYGDYIHRCGRAARVGRPGTSIALVTQYDVQRVQLIEQHTGSAWEALPLDEATVLKGLKRVMDARRQARLNLGQPGGFDERLLELRRMRRRGQERRAAGLSAASAAD